MTTLRNAIASVVMILLAVPVGVVAMVCVLPLAIAFAVLMFPTLAGLCVLERVGVPGARQMREALSETKVIPFVSKEKSNALD